MQTLIIAVLVLFITLWAGIEMRFFRDADGSVSITIKCGKCSMKGN